MTAPATSGRPQPGDGAYLASMTQNRQTGGARRVRAADDRWDSSFAVAGDAVAEQEAKGVAPVVNPVRTATQARINSTPVPRRLSLAKNRLDQPMGTQVGLSPYDRLVVGRQWSAKAESRCCRSREAAHAQTGPNGTTSTALRASAADFQPPSAQPARTYISSNGGLVGP